MTIIEFPNACIVVEKITYFERTDKGWKMYLDNGHSMNLLDEDKLQIVGIINGLKP
jgi:hypothetical protein